jgi:hypothetical protein
LTADLRPGAIVYTYIATITPPKEKFGLVAHIDIERDSAALFLIHTELPKFVQSQPDLVKGVTKIDKLNHPFLDYDSWIRFGDVHACPYSNLVRQAHSNSRFFCGYASNALLERLLKLIPESPELSPRWQNRYCDSLRPYIKPEPTSP